MRGIFPSTLRELHVGRELASLQWLQGRKGKESGLPFHSLLLQTELPCFGFQGEARALAPMRAPMRALLELLLGLVTPGVVLMKFSIPFSGNPSPGEPQGALASRATVGQSQVGPALRGI